MVKATTKTIAADALDTSIKVTILEAAANKLQTKRFHKDGCEPCSQAKYFKPSVCEIQGFEGLVDLLDELSRLPTKMVVAGSVCEGLRNEGKIRRLANPKDRDSATLEDQGSFLLVFDVDDVAKPNYLNWDDPEALAKWLWSQICDRLPALKDVCVIWQASSSAATEGKDHLAKFHYCCLSDRPLFTHERKFLFELVGSDPKLAGIAQPNYTAFPVFDGVPDPLEGLPRSGILWAANERLDTSSIAFPKKETARHPKTKKNKLSKAKVWEAKSFQGVDSSSKKGKEQLSKSCEKFATQNLGNTTIYSEAMLIGGFVAAGEISWRDALEQLLAAAQSTGHDRYKEAVENGLNDGLSRPISGAGNSSEIEPFYPRTNLPRDRAVALHSKIIEDWGSRALAFLGKGGEAPLSYPSKTVPRALLSGAQGVGKTAAIVGRNGGPGFLHKTRGLVTLMLLPDHQKVEEALSDYSKSSPSGAPDAIALRGRNRPDPVADCGNTKMCRAYPTARHLSDLGISIRSTLCKKCPFQKECGYLHQERELKALLKIGDGVIIFAPHEYAYLPLPAEADPHVVIFDERPRDFGVEVAHISLSELTEFLFPSRNPRKKARQSRDVEVGDAIIEQDQSIAPVKQALLAVAANPIGVHIKQLSDFGVTKERLAGAIAALDQFKSRDAFHNLKPVLESEEGTVDEGALTDLRHKLSQAKANHAGRLQFVFECLLWDMENRLNVASSVFTHVDRSRSSEHAAGFAAVRLRQLKYLGERPFLYLDGTADHELARLMFGQDLETHHYPVERNAHVTQVLGCNFAKRRLCKQTQEKQVLTSKIKEENAALSGYVEDVIGRYPNAAVFGSKGIIDSLKITPQDRAGHFGKLRGQNRWEHCEQAIVIGREQPSYLDVEMKARAYAAAAGQEFKSGDYQKSKRGIRMRGGVHAIEVMTHRDQWGDRILRQIREAEIEQAMDRIRLIHNVEPKQVFLMSPVVANVTVDQVVEWKDFKHGGTSIKRAIEKHGILFLSAADCAAYMPDIWKSRQDAHNHLKRANLLSKSPCEINLNGKFDDKGPLMIEFRPEVGEGKKPRRKFALVFPTIDDVRDRLETRTGPLSEFRIIK